MDPLVWLIYQNGTDGPSHLRQVRYSEIHQEAKKLRVAVSECAIIQGVVLKDFDATQINQPFIEKNEK